MWTRFVQWTVDIYRDSVLNAAVLMDTVEKDARVTQLVISIIIILMLLCYYIDVNECAPISTNIPVMRMQSATITGDGYNCTGCMVTHNYYTIKY